MGTNIKETAKEIAVNCKTCKEAENQYKSLIESGIEKETAKAIIKDAKSIINNRKETAKTEKTAVSDWFGNSENIGKSLLLGFLKDTDFHACKEETAKFKSIREFVESWITKADATGQPIRKTANGWKYREITAQNIRAIIRECLTNIVKCNNLQPVNFERIETAEIVTE